MMRMAFIGLGAVVRRIHLPACRRLRGIVEVVGGADPDPAARDAARRLGVAEVEADASRLLARLAPDLVAVCTPPDRHLEDTDRALAAGAHVFLEKPLAPTLEQADAIVTAAARAGRRVVVNNQFPWMRIHSTSKAFLSGSEFGRLLHLHAWHTMRPTRESEAGWRGDLSRRLGLEFGIHVMDLVRFYFEAMPTRVWALHPRPKGPEGADSLHIVALEFGDGRAASVILDRLSQGPDRYLDLSLDGELATIRTSIGGQAELRAGLRTPSRRPFVSWHFGAGGQAVLSRGERSRVLATDPLNPFAVATAAHLRDCVAAIQQGRPIRSDAWSNRDSLALVVAAYQSAQCGQPVAVAPAGPGAA